MFCLSWERSREQDLEWLTVVCGFMQHVSHVGHEGDGFCDGFFFQTQDKKEKKKKKEMTQTGNLR